MPSIILGIVVCCLLFIVYLIMQVRTSNIMLSLAVGLRYASPNLRDPNRTNVEQFFP